MLYSCVLQKTSHKLGLMKMELKYRNKSEYTHQIMFISTFETPNELNYFGVNPIVRL